MSDTVVIVDDSLTVRMDLVETFGAAGFHAIPCATIAEARRALADGPADLVVLDVVLPDGDGIELLAELRARPANAATVFLLLSSEAEVKDRMRGLRTGADEYVGKPYDAGYVVAKGRELVHARRHGGGDGPGSVLVIDDSVTFRERLREALEDAGYTVEVAGSGEDGLRLAAERRPGGIVVDGQLPGIDGATVIRRVRLDAALRSVPCVLLTGSDGEGAELAALDAGADGFARKEEDIGVTLARLTAVLRRGAAPVPGATPSALGPKRILAVDDSATYRHELAAALRQEGYDVIMAATGEEALELLAVQPVDCILLDLLMPGMGGQAACLRIKAAPVVRDIPLILLTANDDRAAMIEGLSAGADDYIAKAGDFAVLKARVRAQLRRRQFEDEHRRIRGELLHKELEAAEARAARALAETRAVLVGQLETRVAERTAELRKTADELEAEVAERQRVASRLQVQVARFDLLNQITHAIGERQDLDSIFQVVVRSLEDQLRVDFGCVCRYDPQQGLLHVACVGQASSGLAEGVGLLPGATIPASENGMVRCVSGQLVYEPEIAGAPFPFLRRLAAAGLHALVAAPLHVKGAVFGVLLVARRAVDGFSSPDCEFLGQLSGHVALAANQAQLHGALQQAYDELRRTQESVMQQERLRALGQMASGIAHDINNAISPVMLYTESLLEREPGLSPRTRGYLEIIQRAIEDVAHTVGRMREFYRQRETQSSLVPVDLNELVGQVLDLTRARWHDMPQQRGAMVRAQTELTSGLPVVAGVAAELREALTNLVFNAVDAMPDGGTLTLRTGITEEAGGRLIHVEVADTGTGMDEETRRRCLEPFFTTKGERGTGLGLAMVYGVAQRHQAEIAIDSAPGRGTAFRIVLPAPAAAADASRPLLPHARPPRLRLLVVDDDPLLLKSLRDTLAEDGHAVVAADGGQAGIDAFRAALVTPEAFAMVITDLGMPYVDGRRVAAAVKELAPAVPVILLTGWGQRLVAEGDIPPGVDVVLNKPPKLRELREALLRLSAGTENG